MMFWDLPKSLGSHKLKSASQHSCCRPWWSLQRLASPKLLNLYCKWTILSPVASPGFFSGTFDCTTWCLLQFRGFHGYWGCLGVLFGPSGIALHCLFMPSKSVTPAKLLHYQVQLPAWEEVSLELYYLNKGKICIFFKSCFRQT